MGLALEEEKQAAPKGSQARLDGFEVVSANASGATRAGSSRGAGGSGKTKRADVDDDDSDDSDDGAAAAAAAAAADGYGTAPVVQDVDPRLLDYDSDTHAEMLALGLQMRKHTTAKALIDAR